MELKDIKTFRKGMIAFAEEQGLMTRITRVEKGEIDFHVMNGMWEGTIHADGTASHMHGAIKISMSDFKQVISVTPDEYHSWYMEGEQGTKALVSRDDKLPIAPEDLSRGEESQVHEAKILITVMGQDEDPHALNSWLQGVSLSDLEREMDSGDLIGQSRMISFETLAADQVGPRLKDLANDGRFFNHDEEQAFDADAKKEEAAGRILNAQMSQGWGTESLEMLSRRFIEQVGLSDTYARFLEDQAREENDHTSDLDDGIAF